MAVDLRENLIFSSTSKTILIPMKKTVLWVLAFSFLRLLLPNQRKTSDESTYDSTLVPLSFRIVVRTLTGALA